MVSAVLRYPDVTKLRERMSPRTAQTPRSEGRTCKRRERPVLSQSCAIAGHSMAVAVDEFGFRPLSSKSPGLIPGLTVSRLLYLHWAVLPCTDSYVNYVSLRTDSWRLAKEHDIADAVFQE